MLSIAFIAALIFAPSAHCATATDPARFALPAVAGIWASVPNGLPMLDYMETSARNAWRYQQSMAAAIAQVLPRQFAQQSYEDQQDYLMRLARAGRGKLRGVDIAALFPQFESRLQRAPNAPMTNLRVSHEMTQLFNAAAPILPAARRHRIVALVQGVAQALGRSVIIDVRDQAQAPLAISMSPRPVDAQLTALGTALPPPDPNTMQRILGKIGTPRGGKLIVLNLQSVSLRTTPQVYVMVSDYLAYASPYLLEFPVDQFSFLCQGKLRDVLRARFPFDRIRGDDAIGKALNKVAGSRRFTQKHPLVLFLTDLAPGFKGMQSAGPWLSQLMNGSILDPGLSDNLFVVAASKYKPGDLGIRSQKAIAIDYANP